MVLQDDDKKLENAAVVLKKEAQRIKQAYFERRVIPFDEFMRTRRNEKHPEVIPNVLDYAIIANLISWIEKKKGKEEEHEKWEGIVLLIVNNLCLNVDDFKQNITDIERSYFWLCSKEN